MAEANPDRGNSPKSRDMDERISLAPVDVEDALAALLKVKPEDAESNTRSPSGDADGEGP